MKFSTLRRLVDIKTATAAFSVCGLLACSSASAGEAGGTTSDGNPTLPTTGAEVGTDAGSGTGTDPGTGTGTDPGTDPGTGTDAGTDVPTDPGTPTDPAADPYAVPAGKMPFRGNNLAGAEFGTAIPGREGTDYNFPTAAMVDYYLGKGMNTFRFGFKWERMQPTANGEFDATYFSKLDAVITYATSKGAHAILNPHNFAMYYGAYVGTSQVPNSAFADFWTRMAKHYAANPNVMFNLMNEPHDLPTMQWVGAANAAIAGIRGAGAKNVIIAPGNNWTGAHSWYSNSGGASNAVGMLEISDPLNNTLYEVHQYLDANSGGGSGACVSTTIGSERLKAWVGWLKEHGKKGFVGEFAGRNDATCKTAIDDMITYMHANSDVISGWLWWAGGPGWGDYVFTLEPKNGQDRPQMAWLSPFLAEPR